MPEKPSGVPSSSWNVRSGVSTKSSRSLPDIAPFARQHTDHSTRKTTGDRDSRTERVLVAEQFACGARAEHADLRGFAVVALVEHAALHELPGVQLQVFR